MSQDEHNLCLRTENISEQEVVEQIKSWMVSYPDCEYKYSLGKNHHDQYLNFGYLWVAQKEVYFDILNLTHDRESRVTTTFTKDGTEVHTRLPPIINIDNRIKVTPTIITSNEHATTLVIRPCPNPNAKEKIEQMVKPLSTSTNARYPYIAISPLHNCGYLKFDPTTFDANFADKIFRKCSIDNIVYTLKLQR